MQRWHEQRGGRPGLANRVVHLGHPAQVSMTVCGCDVYAGDMKLEDRSRITCRACVEIIVTCRRVPKRMLDVHHLGLPGGKIKVVGSRAA